MSELTEFSLSDLDENSTVTGLEEHSLRVKVSLEYPVSVYKSPLDDSSLRDESSVIPFTSQKRSSSISNISSKAPRHTRQMSHQSSNSKVSVFSPKFNLNRTQTFATPTKSKQVLPRSSNPQTLVQKRFEENLKKIEQTISFNESFTQQSFTNILHVLGFIKLPETTTETTDLYKLFSQTPSISHLRSLLSGILGLNEDKSFKSYKEKFPSLYSGYFKSKRKNSLETSTITYTPKSSPRPSLSYKVIQHNQVVKENYNSVADYLLSYQKTFESKMERTTERVNKEKYKECTFQPTINKKSKHIDSTPKAHKKKNPYISLKGELNVSRNETLYEFAEVSRNLKNESIKQHINEESLRFTQSPSVKILKSSENTPVKGLDSVIKRMQKARAEKQWKTGVLERGSTISNKEKENCKKTFDLISELELLLPTGEKDTIRYCKGENIGYIVSDFCLKHKLKPEFHEKIVKIVVKSKGRESHQLF